jgi:hypothetical protein
MSPEQWTEEDLNEPREAEATNPADAGAPPRAPEPSQAATEAHSDERCGFTVYDSDGEEQPCDRPTTGWRWYQGHEHEDALDVACELHENEGGRRIHAAERALADERAKVARVEAALDNEPIIVAAIRRDLERNPDGRGGEIHFIPTTPGYGRSGCPGDNLSRWPDEIRAALAGPEPEASWRRLNCPVCGSGEVGDCVCPETEATEEARCQYVSESPWGLTQCALPEHDNSVRHAFSPSEAIEGGDR